MGVCVCVSAGISIYGSWPVLLWLFINRYGSGRTERGERTVDQRARERERRSRLRVPLASLLSLLFVVELKFELAIPPALCPVPDAWCLVPSLPPFACCRRWCLSVAVTVCRCCRRWRRCRLPLSLSPPL